MLMVQGACALHHIFHEAEKILLSFVNPFQDLLVFLGALLLKHLLVTQTLLQEFAQDFTVAASKKCLRENSYIRGQKETVFNKTFNNTRSMYHYITSPSLDTNLTRIKLILTKAFIASVL